MYDLLDDVDVYAYSDSAITVLVASDIQIGTTSEYLVWTPATDVYYLRMDGSKTSAGSTYYWSCD